MRNLTVESVPDILVLLRDKCYVTLIKTISIKAMTLLTRIYIFNSKVSVKMLIARDADSMHLQINILFIVDYYV